MVLSPKSPVLHNLLKCRLDLFNPQMVQTSSLPKLTNLSGIFDGPRSKSRPSPFVAVYILQLVVPMLSMHLKFGLNNLLTSSRVQNVLKDVLEVYIGPNVLLSHQL